MSDRAAAFERVLRLEPGRTALLVIICVLATVVGAFNREYRITVVGDAVATLSPEIQRAALDIVGRAFGRVTSGKELLDTLAGW